MATNKTDRAFKTLINRETTDSNNKSYFNELGADTINVHAADIWADYIPNNDPAQAVSLNVAVLETLYVLTEDITVLNRQSWRANDRDWISPKFGAAFTIHLYDGLNNEIFLTDSLEWFFDYQTGILTFNGSFSRQAPLKITGYRYVGAKGITGDSATVYATEVELLADSPPAGTIGYAIDTETFWWRKNGLWELADGGSSGNWYTENWVATSGQVLFGLSLPISSSDSLRFTVNGVEYLEGQDYTRTGQVITWLNVSFTMGVGDRVSVQYLRT